MFKCTKRFTDLPPLSFSIVVLEEALVIRNSVVAVDPAKEEDISIDRRESSIWDDLGS